MNQINRNQQRLFNKLFATLPSVKKVTNFNNDVNFDGKISYIFYFKNKDFWFTKYENNDKFFFLFGIKDKSIKDITGKDTCLIIDFDQNIQFNSDCLGLFSIKNAELHILINNNILQEKYPYINTFGLKKTNFKSVNNPLELEVIDLGNLNNDFIDNLERLIKATFKIQSKNKELSQNAKIASHDYKRHSKDKIEEKTVIELENNTLEQMEIVLEAISNGKSRKEAAELAKIPRYKILHWCNEGRNGDKPEYTFFLRRLEELDRINKTKNKMDEVLNELKNGKDIYQSRFFEVDEVNNWIEKGKQNIVPYDYFYREYDLIIKEQIKEYETKEINRKIFLENFKSGKTKEESAKNADIDLSVICNWYFKGQEGVKPYVDFFKACLSVKKSKKPKIPKLIKTDSFGNKNTLMNMNKILEYLAMGKSEDEAIRYAKISKTTYKYWMNRGKQEFGELYIQFYYYVNQIKYGIYDDGEEDPQEKLIDPDIYAPLPIEYENAFKSSPMNQTGIAWVNMPGTGIKFSYSKSINGKKINFIEDDIYELHRIVKENNHVWGIRDYERARKIIDIPDDFVIPSKPKIMDANDNVPEEIDPDIYAPLPAEYGKQFIESKSNKTGIAWVNYVGKQWVYQRNINKNKIYFADENIYNLHQKIKENNLTWGIKDYNKASRIIDIPDDFIIPETKEEPIVISSDILSPLPEKYFSSFNPNQKNKTGIAWVNKVGNKWIYQRSVNKINIRFSEYDIHELYETVIKNKQVWGIIDFDKAKPIIESNQIEEEPQLPEPQITPEPIDSNTVTVNYIDKSINELDVIIKGVIDHNDLIEIFNRLKLFEKNIKRIIATPIGNNVDIFIELEFSKYLKNTFEEKLDDLGWNIG